MAKTRKKAVPTTGYISWGIKRTIKEAENVSRWNPWLGHLWMEEARNSIDLDNPFYTEFDEAAARINNFWRIIKGFSWYEEADFWGALDRPPECTYIKSTLGDVDFSESLDLAFA